MTHLINYHNHTPLCGHATGTMEQLIEEAIKQHFAEFGFSDHAPLPGPYQEGITMLPHQMEGYIASVEKIKETYKGAIAVKLGLEIDFPLFDTFDKKYLTDARFDYLIGSCHIIDGWVFDYPGNTEKFENGDINEIYRQYYAIIEDLVDSSLFQVVGHFDLIKKFGYRPAKSFKETYEKIAAKMAANDTAFEVNTSGLLKPVKEIYPSEELVEIFFQNNVAVTMGSDTHSVEDLGHAYDRGIQMLKKTGYTKLSCFDKKKRYEVPL